MSESPCISNSCMLCFGISLLNEEISDATDGENSEKIRSILPKIFFGTEERIPE